MVEPDRNLRRSASTLALMKGEDGLEDDEPAGAPDGGWLHPDDRLWRHPSELAVTPWPSAIAPPPSEDGPTAGAGAGRDPRPWSLALLAGAIGALLASGLIATAGGLSGGKTTVVRPIEQVVRPLANPDNPVAVTSPEDPVVSIAQRIRPAIVQIVVDGDKGHSGGSGVVFRSDGHILTNNHVVDGANAITVIMPNGRQTKAKLVGADPETDIAVLKIPVDDDQNLPVAPLGSAGTLKVGQRAVAIGSPLGLVGGPSVTVGVVSAVGRQVDPRDAGPPLLDMIQTDAPIAPGSSGGALADSQGEVIGITTAIAVSDVGVEGFGFATPIDVARDTADQLIDTGKVVHVWMGVEGEDVDNDTANRLSIDGGAVVKSVRSKSPASTAGLAAQDIITQVDGKAVTSMGALIVALRSHRPGDAV